MKSRSALLTSAVFGAAVGGLLLNDHVLKSAWPGLVTGKLSDIAGVVMLAILLTVVTGHRRSAFGVTAAGFTLLKTVPLVAVAAAPVLGGVTRTDPTDLVALVVLVPCWKWVGNRPDSARPRSSRLGAAEITMLLAAVFATTATSSDARLDGAARDGDRFVLWTDEEVFTSDDGGASWTIDDGDDVPRDSYDRDYAPQQACATPELCFTVEGRSIVEEDDGDRAVSIDATDERLASLVERDDDLVGSGVADAILAAQLDDGTHVVAVFQRRGVLHRAPDGTWEWRPNNRFDRSPGVLGFVGVRDVFVFGALFGVPLLVLASAPAARRRAQRGLRDSGDAANRVLLTGFGLLFVSTAVVILTSLEWLSGLDLVFAALVTLVGAATIVWAHDSDRSHREPIDQPPPPNPSERLG